MTFTVYPKGNRALSSGIEDRTPLDVVPDPIFRYVESKYSVSLFDVYGGDYEIRVEDFGKIEIINELLRFEAYRQDRYVENGKEMSDKIVQFIKQITVIMDFCKNNNVPIAHFAD